MGMKFSPAMQLAAGAVILIARGVFMILWIILRVAGAIVKHLADGTSGSGPEGYLTHTNPYWHWHIPPPR